MFGLHSSLVFACVATLFVFFLPSTSVHAISDCSLAKMDELLEPGSDDAPEVMLNCRAILSNSSHVITKKVVFKGAGASGAVLDCAGGSIRAASSKGSKYTVTVRSAQDSAGVWQRPNNITVRHCTIHRSVRVYGMAPVASDELRELSYQAGYTEKLQRAAPHHIVFDRVTIVGEGMVPFYVSPGATYVSLINSEIKGEGNSVAVYLDHESGYNTIKNNYIHLNSVKREQVAVDGSAHNRIVNNRFSGLDTGGIYLYRNCGERGVVRHQTPSHNQIINNVFYYNSYSGSNPSIWVGSRDTFWRNVGTFFGVGYCDDDNGYPYGSSKSNEDYARYNVIAENQIYKLSTSKMIKQAYSPNYYFFNQTVTTPVARKAGCYLLMDGQQRFLRHGEAFVYQTTKSNNTGYRYACNDSELRHEGPLATSSLSFDCRTSENNAGATCWKSCPQGKQLVSIKAACNLEFGLVPSTFVSSLAANKLAVQRASDNVSEGRCSLSASARTVTTSKTTVNTDILLGSDHAFLAHCREHDRNGGDCHIVGEAKCL